VRSAGRDAHPPGGPLDLARLIDRVAVLVDAGTPPPRAWALASSASAASAAGAQCVGGVEHGHGGGRAHDDPTHRDVHGVLAVAARTGAPVVPALRALAVSLRDSAAAERSVRVALAGPRSSARVVLALPAFGTLLGSMWGVDTIGVLVHTPVGWGCLSAAAFLVTVAQRWTSRLVAAAAGGTTVPGLLLDVWAVALSGGGAWADAASTVESVFGARDWPEGDRARLAETLTLAERAGVPAAGLLRACAVDSRADAAAEGLARAERLGVRLVLPLGVCVLPAFVLVGVVPVVLGILSSTSDGFG
jgi:tight adherence protein B